MFTHIRQNRLTALLVALLLSITLSSTLVGCQGNQPVETNRVAIKNSRYNPSLIKVKVAETITFKNEDDIEHTVTAENFATPNQVLSPGSEIDFVPQEPLELLYFCQIHKFRGKIIVVPQATP